MNPYQPNVKTRQIARTLGVSDQTVGRALATNVARPSDKPNETDEKPATNATNVAPTEFTGEGAAKLVLRRETASVDRIASGRRRRRWG